jgi:competence protein ComEC
LQHIAAWIEAEQGRFALLLPVAMGAAILVYFGLKAEPPLWLGLSLTAASLLATITGWRFPPSRFAGAIALSAALGFAAAQWRTASLPPLLDVPYGSVAITGTAASIDDLPTGRRLTIAPAQLNAGPPLARAIRVKLNAHDDTIIAPGDQISLRAILFKPERPAYPGAWDTTRDNFFAGLGASGFELGTLSVTAAAHPQGFSVRLRGLREAIAGTINATLAPDAASVAVTLLTGLQNQMAPDERQQFIAAGLAHLLAVAGLHVGIVMGLFYAASRYLLTRHERTALRLPVKPIAALIALGSGCVYALLTGAHLPILRSLAMASLVTAGVIAGRRAISLRGLALAAMLILLATPEAIIGVSFQMSFSAVLALISGYAAARTCLGRLNEHRSPAARTCAHLVQLFLTSLLAGGASMPFAAYQFAQIQPYWILANLLAVPLTALWVMPAGVLAFFLMPLHLAALALIPMGWGIGIILWLTRLIAAWPEAMLRVAPLPAQSILLYAGGLAWLCIWRTRLRLAGIAPILLALVVYAGGRPPDVLVSADARLLAVRSSEGGILLYRAPKASAYTLGQWQSLWPGQILAPLDPGVCAGNGCALTASASVLLDAAAACPTAPVILSPIPLRGACDGLNTLVIDRLTAYRQGAVAVWLDARKPYVRTDRAVQGTRPWVPPWPTT